YSANTTLTAAEAGKLIRLGGAGLTITLPAVSAVADGRTFVIQHSGTGGVHTVVTQGADVIDPGPGLITQVVLQYGDTAVISKASGNWALYGGSAALPYVSIETRPAFSKDKRLANTEYVQQMLGNRRAWQAISADLVLTMAAAGSGYVWGGVDNVTVTLPPKSEAIAGTTFIFHNTNSGTITVQATAGDTIDIGPMPVSSVVVEPYTSLEVVCVLASTPWGVVGAT